MKGFSKLLLAIGLSGLLQAQEIHVWEPHELTFQANNQYENPYIEIEFWVLLTGPEGSGFKEKRVWGFWDGENVFRVRVTATIPGQWTWKSDSNQPDSGLRGKSGSFTAKEWTEAEKQVNPNRRGTVRPTPNNRAFMYADGTPFFLLADTHWGSSTWRLPLSGEEPPSDYVIAKDNYSFEGAIQWLKKKGFNSITMIVSHPNWFDDGKPPLVKDCKGVVIRQAKNKTGFDKVREMHDEEGNMPFLFTSKSGCPEDKIADYDRPNPAYWQSLDKKFQYMQGHGIVCYAEAARRDHGQTWKNYFDWPRSYAKYLNYLQARYGVYNMIFSLMHGDKEGHSISFADWNAAFDYWYQHYGGLPFGQVQTLMGLSTLRDFGHVTEHPWMQAHTVGNSPKHHVMEENLIKIWKAEPPIPGFCNGPCYVNFNKPWNEVDGELPPSNSPRDNYLARAHAYDHVLSGGLPGHIIGTGSRWDNSKEEPDDPDYPGGWETMRYPIMDQARYLKAWILSAGTAYRDLDLAKDDLSAPKAPGSKRESLDGWSHMMRTRDRKLAFLYFENKAVNKQAVSGLLPNREYRATWLDPSTGKRIDMTPGGLMKTDGSGSLTLPPFPATNAENKDWAARLALP